MERKCIECDTIIHGRIDKKYCSEYCRNGHNNKLNRDLNNLMRTTHNHLRKNYRVLQELIKTKSMIKIKKKHLINKGFNFDISYPYSYKNNGSIYFYIYDLGYLQLDNKRLVIIKKETYL